MFIDVAKIHIKAGDGGNGAVSFHREKYIAAGGPDGGDGGRGGNIVFVADTNLSTLADFRYKRKYIAKNGENGKKNRCSGRKAEDLVIKVPNGTLVKNAKTDKILADISTEELKVIARGGKGGWGNQHFANATRQVPKFSKPGMPGEEYEVKLELKLLADVGIVGFPNVGKSTLVSVVSHAKPVVANYHFTTLTPVLGVVNRHKSASFVIADIPGLIEGAEQGVGLGHKFLRHVERCRLLVHMVDISGSEGRDPIEDFEIINSELEKFNLELSKRPMIVVGNKCDIASDEQIERFRDYVISKGYEFFPIMAAIRHQVDPLLDKLESELAKLPPITIFEPEEIPSEEITCFDINDVLIEKSDNTYFIESPWLNRFIMGLNLNDFESLQYFQKVLKDKGIMEKLISLGLKSGDSINVYGFEMNFID